MGLAKWILVHTYHEAEILHSLHLKWVAVPSSLWSFVRLELTALNYRPLWSYVQRRVSSDTRSVYATDLYHLAPKECRGPLGSFFLGKVVYFVRDIFEGALYTLWELGLCSVVLLPHDGMRRIMQRGSLSL